MSAATVSAVLGCTLLTYFYIDFYRRSRLPPGPRGIPLIGNLTIIPQKDETKVVSEWSRQYGDLVYLRLLNTSVLFVHGVQATNELFDKRGSIYSDRPFLPMASDLCGFGELVPLTPFGNRFKAERRLMSQSLSRRAVARWEPYLLEEVQTLLKNFLSKPDEFVANAQRMAGSLIFRTIYGYRVEKTNDPYVNAAQDFMNISTHAMVGGWLVDVIPFLKSVPFLKFQRLAASWRSKTTEWVDEPYKLFLRLMSKDVPDAQISFCGNLLPETTHDKEKEHLTKWIAASVYAAGSDSSVASITQLILAMVLHPRVLIKAQAEIDAVIGRDRLPDFSDRPNLPYVECVLKESVRWGTPVSFTPPHRLMQDDIYEGYVIPKGTWCLGNIWAILHDERIYDSPHEFRPERFLNLPDEETKRLLDPYTYMFGFGRRRCPGMDFADPSLWITTVMLISCFQISHARDEHGRIIEVKAAYKSGAIRHPEPFKCKIEPRHNHITQLINEDWLLSKS